MIYKVINKINKKPYIGKTDRTLDERRKEHEKTQSNSLFHKAIRKYGIENFKWNIEDESGEEEYYIKKYNSHFIDGYGYNMTYGGENYPKEYMDILWNDPDFKERHAIATGKATKKSWKNKKTRERRSKEISKAKIKQYKNDKEYKNKIINHIKNQAKRNWLNDEYRKKTIEARSKIHLIENIKNGCVFQINGYYIKQFCDVYELNYGSFRNFLSSNNRSCFKKEWKKCQKSMLFSEIHI